MKTEKVLDYVVKSKICFECKARNNWEKSSDRYKKWYIKYENESGVNHIKASGETEKGAAETLFYLQ